MHVSTKRDLSVGAHGHLYELSVPDAAFTTLPVTYLYEWERARSKAGHRGGNQFIGSLHESLKRAYAAILFRDHRGHTERGLVLDLSCVATFKKVGEFGVGIGRPIAPPGHADPISPDVQPGDRFIRPKMRA